MNATHTFSCGHQGDEPRNMGRGARRQVRLTEYFARRCKACRIATIEAESYLMCKINAGKAIKLSEAERLAFVARQTAKIA